MESDMVMSRNPHSAYPRNVLDLMTTDPQLRNAIPLPELSPPVPADKDHSYQELIEAITQGYADRPAIGTRAYRIGRDPLTGQSSRIFLPEFDMISYGELNTRIKKLAAAWQSDPVYRVDPGDFVCIIGFSGIDYVTIELACAYAQAASVPLQATLGSHLTTVFAKTAPTCVAATINDIIAAAEMAAEHSTVRTVIAFDHDIAIDADRERLATAREILASGNPGAALITLGELLDQSDGIWRPLPASPQGTARTATLIHSSGSTGEPKGAILTEAATMWLWSATSQVPLVRIVFAPMNHQVGRGKIFSSLARGGTAYVTAKPDLSELFTDIKLVRPTELIILPRVMEMIHRHFLGEVIRRGEGREAQEVRAEVMAEMRGGFLGDRLCLISTGSAPTAQEVKDFISECFQLPLNEGYGTTEAGSIMANGRVRRPPVIDYKLTDVPELGYLTSDKPHPRGELWIKTETAIPGYFKQPEATASLYDEEGFIRTGDIMEERAPDHLVYLDRSNDVLKLSQGEFVATSTLGGVFEARCPTIQQIYVYGNSARSFLLAVIVPDMEIIEARLGVRPDESRLRALIRDEIKAAAALEKRRAVEIPRDFIIEYEPFSCENGLLTSVMKRKRPALRARYCERLEALYDAIEERQNHELRTLRDANGMSLQDKVVKAVEASLGIEAGDVCLSSSFSDLGGDSLAATAFATLLEEMFGVKVSVNLILSPAGNVGTWARTVESVLANQCDMLAYEQIHGEDKSRIDADDLDIATFLDAGAFEAGALDPPPETTRCVLLTGATGFLGRFLCLEWLERMEACNGKIICLVRATDQGMARDRLYQSFATDAILGRRFEVLAERHLEIIVGDVAAPRLGLTREVFVTLTKQVDHIVHCSALVNHVLSYPDLFGPNVAGIAQLVVLALTERRKRFDYISSLAVSNLLEPGHPKTEAAPLARTIVPRNSYGEGYAISKWAGETLLHSANARFGLPVTIFRCDMILANRRYANQVNQADSLTRLLYSLLVTETAPASFYKPGADGQRHPAHYDGLPSDFVAAAIAGISDSVRSSSVQTFHVLNQHEDDGVSLDSFVDWMIEAGHPIAREPDYARWLEQFEVRLRALPDVQRQRSVLAVLHGYGKPLAGSHGIDNSAFVAAVSALPMRQVPHIDRALIDKYLQILQSKPDLNG